MIIKLLKTFYFVVCLGAAMLSCVVSVKAQEITAIDFNGAVIGKVIPDGKVVGFENQLIGNITADSLIVDFKGKLIGGVVPQGIAIGNDARLLGKVGNDGAVRLPSGQVVGKALPNGLVVNELFDIVGGIVFPGIVYGDNGNIVGRVSGDGTFVNLNGQKLGLITPDGYAYHKVDDEYVLSGRLVSSKMVVSLQGDFIGSVVPGGEVSNFDSEVIGYIKANGYAFDAKNSIIGHVVNTGYAFDNNGKYIGIITYNGEVVNADNIVGRIRADGVIVDDKNDNIGYGMGFGATATDLRGRYLGRLLPEGYISRTQEKSFSVGARGVVFDDKGTPIGKISKTGPVFDYKGEHRGHALSNGTVISLGGTPIGQMVGSKAFDLSGREIGAVAEGGIVFDTKNNILGIPGVNSQIVNGEASLYVSPQRYVFNQEGILVGENVALGGIYAPNGTYVASIGLDGKAVSSSGNKIGDIVGGGYVLDSQKRLLGKNIVSELFSSLHNQFLGIRSQENLLLDASKKITAKIIPDNSLIATDEQDSVNYSPRVGMSYDDGVILDFNGDLLGYADVLGNVNKLSGAKIGKLTDRNLALDNNGLVIGNIVSYGASINDECNLVGVLTPRGDIRNHRGTYLGRVLGNGYVISDSGANIAHMAVQGPIIDYTGKIIGFSNIDGYTYNSDNEQLGCVDRKGYLRDGDGRILGRRASYTTVMDFKDKIVGRSILDGQIVNKNNLIMGYQQPDGNVNSSAGLPMGTVFEYRFAFGLDNKLLGLVSEEGIVYNNKKEEIGSVNFEGYIIKGKEKIGYALYDLYVYDNEDNVVGYINRNGSVVDFNNQYLGQIDKGFVVGKKEEIIARGARDYNIRDNSHLVLGYLMLNGQVVNLNNEIVGTIDKVGSVNNAKGDKVAQAYPLQYYSNISASVSRKMMFDKDGNFIGHLDENGNIVNEKGETVQFASKDKETLVEQKHNVFDKDGNLIGVTDSDGNVLDSNNKIIGKINEAGEVVDGNGNIIGGIGKNWYEKAPLPTETIDEEEDISPALKLLESGTYKKSLGIALTPDGEYLGDITEDHRVVNKEGVTVGRLMPDGLVIDDDGNLVGVKETERPNSSGMFVPPGTFGDGGAYGTGAGTPGNLGPGGGYGPGERYDPARQAALDAAMVERRKNISVGKISSGIRKEAFDGMQKDWSEQGINKVISSWRVDMSEMIFSDKPIPAVIARAIDSNNPAPITAFVERNVYAEEGRNVIIPAGSRLIGSLGGVSASAESTSESARVQISWERLIRPDGSIFVFQALTADAQGRGGALGYVDQQLFKKYTLPIMTSSLTSATSYFMAPSDNDSGENESPRQQAANDARENFINEMNQVFDEILADKSNIRPLTYIPAGTRIIVYPNSDLWLRSVERDSEESAKFQAEKPTILLDDTKGGSLKDGPTPQPGASVSTGGDVVYDAGSDVEEAPNVALIDDSSSKKKKKSVPYVTPPPPPPSSSAVASTTPSADSRNKKNSDNAIPALF